jgi:hypothetical protein
MCLPNRCLAMGICVTLFSPFSLCLFSSSVDFSSMKLSGKGSERFRFVVKSCLCTYSSPLCVVKQSCMYELLDAFRGAYITAVGRPPGASSVMETLFVAALVSVCGNLSTQSAYVTIPLSPHPPSPNCYLRNMLFLHLRAELSVLRHIAQPRLVTGRPEYSTWNGIFYLWFI